MLGTPATTSDPQGLVTELLEQGFASVVMTLGAEGALVGTPGQLTAIPTPKIQAVDTTGSGDAFAGALVARRWPYRGRNFCCARWRLCRHQAGRSSLLPHPDH